MESKTQGSMIRDDDAKICDKEKQKSLRTKAECAFRFPVYFGEYNCDYSCTDRGEKRSSDVRHNSNSVCGNILVSFVGNEEGFVAAYEDSGSTVEAQGSAVVWRYHLPSIAYHAL
jgi:hypothetical protein